MQNVFQSWSKAGFQKFVFHENVSLAYTFFVPCIFGLFFDANRFFTFDLSISSFYIPIKCAIIFNIKFSDVLSIEIEREKKTS